MNLETAIGELPDKLSDLLEVALDDFEKVTKHPQVVVDMGYWCRATDGIRSHKVCKVCLAGAVIANRMTPEAVIESQLDFHLTTDCEVSWRKFTAINMLRVGEILEAFSALTGIDYELDANEEPIPMSEFPAGCPTTVNVIHWNGSEGFIPEMRALIPLLRSHGL